MQKQLSIHLSKKRNKLRLVKSLSERISPVMAGQKLLISGNDVKALLSTKKYENRLSIPGKSQRIVINNSMGSLHANKKIKRQLVYAGSHRNLADDPALKSPVNGSGVNIESIHEGSEELKCSSANTEDLGLAESAASSQSRLWSVVEIFKNKLICKLSTLQ